MKKEFNILLGILILFMVLIGCVKPDPPTPDPPKVTLSEITVDYSNAKVKYLIGEEFSSTGLIVTAKYSDNTSKVITNYQLDSRGFIASKEGKYRIVIDYTENNINKTVIYEVEVYSILSVTNYLKGIDVLPRDVEFLIGSEFNIDTLIVTAIYQDNTKVDVTSKAVVDSSRYKKDTVGVYEIVITYSETYGTGENQVVIEWDSFYFARVVETLTPPVVE